MILVQFQVIINMAIPDHEAEGVFINLDLVSNQKKAVIDQIIFTVFSGLNSWDSQYYTFIARNGYDEESKLVFLPLFPLCLRYFSKIVQVLTLNALHETSIMLISAFVLNTIFFVIAVFAIHRLTLVLIDPSGEFAFKTVGRFIVSPATVFFLATYTESMFAALTFTSLLMIHQNQVFTGSILIALSTLTRSNGLITIGFLFHHLVLLYVNGRIGNLQFLFKVIMSTVVTIFPFFYYQFIYIKATYCGFDYDKSKWSFCHASRDWETPYNYLQSRYWKQGFLNYWKLKQIPNFILAMPIILVIVITSITWILINKKLTSNLGFVPLKGKQDEETRENPRENFWKCKFMVPFIFHGLFLVIYGLFFTHVQVITRLICSSTPLIYWIAAAFPSGSGPEKIIHWYFLSYIFLGIVLFSNFYPWT